MGAGFSGRFMHTKGARKPTSQMSLSYNLAGAREVKNVSLINEVESDSGFYKTGSTDSVSIKEDGIFRTERYYDSKGNPYLEIVYLLPCLIVFAKRTIGEQSGEEYDVMLKTLLKCRERLALNVKNKMILIEKVVINSSDVYYKVYVNGVVVKTTDSIEELFELEVEGCSLLLIWCVSKLQKIAYCDSCNQMVPVEVNLKKKETLVDGHVFTYTGLEMKCKLCGNIINSEKLNDVNMCLLKQAWRTKKEQIQS